MQVLAACLGSHATDGDDPRPAAPHPPAAAAAATAALGAEGCWHPKIGQITLACASLWSGGAGAGGGGVCVCGVVVVVVDSVIVVLEIVESAAAIGVRKVLGHPSPTNPQPSTLTSNP